MNRRGFLKGLISAGVITAAAPTLIEEVSRVYSFPTKIVIAQPPLVQAACYVPSSVVGGLPKSLVIYYDKKFIEHLKAKLHFVEMRQRQSLLPASDIPFFIEEDSDESDYYDLEV